MVNGPTAEEKRRGCDWTVDEPGRTTLQNPLRTELLRGGGEAQEGFKEVKAGCPDRDFFLTVLSRDKIVQFSSVTQSCLTLCKPMNCSTSGLPVHHQLQ